VKYLFVFGLALAAGLIASLSEGRLSIAVAFLVGLGVVVVVARRRARRCPQCHPRPCICR
jgi:hypothetical protein